MPGWNVQPGKTVHRSKRAVSLSKFIINWLFFFFSLKKMDLVIVRAVHVCRLYRERLSQVNSKLAEVEAGRAAEYLEPLAVLLENMQVRTKVAGNWTRQRPSCTGNPTHWPFQITVTDVFLIFSGIYRELCLESVKHKYDCETQAACQHWEVRDRPPSFHSGFVCMVVQRQFSSKNLPVCLCRARSCCSSTQYKMNWKRK